MASVIVDTLMLCKLHLVARLTCPMNRAVIDRLASASLASSASISATRSSGATTLFSKPNAAASSADIISPVKSISKETTFNEDTTDRDLLDGHIWRLAQKVSDRAKAKEIAGRIVTLKVKRSNHSSLTRRVTLHEPSNMTDRLYRTARGLLDNVVSEGPFRLIGVGLSDLVPADQADVTGDLLDPQASKRAGAERASDAIRKRFGDGAILKGRALR